MKETNYVRTKKIEEALSIVTTLDTKMTKFISTEARAREALKSELLQIINEQREEIIRLRNEIEKAEEDRQNRRVKAIASMKSE